MDKIEIVDVAEESVKSDWFAGVRDKVIQACRLSWDKLSDVLRSQQVWSTQISFITSLLSKFIWHKGMLIV